MASHVPTMAPDEGVIDAAKAALGEALIEAREAVGEITLVVTRESIATVLRTLRDTPGLEYQQLMEIAGVDYPERPERFEVVYHLLSLTRKHRIRVHVSTDEETPLPSVTQIWPDAGWLEREVYDLYGVLFDGNTDLRRILTDYCFQGHPLRKDFPMTGYVEMRYSEEAKRVVYEPVNLAQDFRNFDFMSPWEGAAYVLPGDEKAEPHAAGAPTPAAATGAAPAVAPKAAAADKSGPPGLADQGGGKPADQQAHKEARKPNSAKAAQQVSKGSATPDPKPKGTTRRRPGGGAG